MTGASHARWRHVWKIVLIEKENPAWSDLAG